MSDPKKGDCLSMILCLVLIPGIFPFFSAIFELVEQFTQLFVFGLTSHNHHPNAGTSTHPSMATAEALTRACQHFRYLSGTI